MSYPLRWIALLAMALICTAWSAPTARAVEPPALQATCPAEVTFGEVFDCGLAGVGEIDSYTFQGATNDRLVVRAARTSGTFSITLRVRDSNGNQVCSDAGSNRATAACTLASSGTFTLQILDYYARATGDYVVYVQRLNAPGAAQPAAFGQLVAGSLGHGIESDTYSFSAEINDQVELRMRRLTGSFSTQIGVYDQGGTRVCSDAGTAAAQIAPCSIKATGTYYVLIDDYYLAAPGTYEWTLQRWGRSGQAQGITLGSAYDGDLTTPIEADVYSFEAAQNDQIILRAQRSAGDMSMRIQVHDAAGNRVCYDAGTAQALVEPCTVASAGVYSVMIDDYYVANTGAYTLHTQRINNPGGARALGFGQPASDGLDKIAALDTYSFEAAQNDVVSLTAARTAGSFSPRLRVYNTGGTLVCSDSGTTQAAINRCALSAAGRYTVILDDYYVQSVGTYTLTLGCVSGACLQPQAPAGRIFLPLIRR